MRLLLLLSALLAALSGTAASARAPQPRAVEVATMLSVAAVAPAHAHVLPVRPVGAPDARVAPVAAAAFVVAPPRLWMQRRRE